MEIMKGPLLDLFGGTFFGEFLTALCLGVLTIQTYSYYRAFPNDGRPLKVAVGFLWALEAFQIGCVTEYLYWGLIKHDSNPLPLGRATWEFGIYQISVVCASVTVQTFFAHRVYSLSTNLYLGILVEVFVLLQFGFGAATAIKADVILDLKLVTQECTWLIVTWLAIQAVADVIIATSMCILLRTRRTGFQRTDSIINRMVFYTISTGLITGVLSCVVLALFAKYGFQFSVLILSVPLGGIYSLTMLANLHVRKTLQTKLAATGTPLRVMNPPMKNRVQLNGTDSHGGKYPPTVVHVTKETVHDDMDGRLTKSSHTYPPASIHPLHFLGE